MHMAARRGRGMCAGCSERCAPSSSSAAFCFLSRSLFCFFLFRFAAAFVLFCNLSMRPRASLAETSRLPPSACETERNGWSCCWPQAIVLLGPW